MSLRGIAGRRATVRASKASSATSPSRVSQAASIRMPKATRLKASPRGSRPKAMITSGTGAAKSMFARMPTLDRRGGRPGGGPGGPVRGSPAGLLPPGLCLPP
jgi:hypothetical protein